MSQEFCLFQKSLLEPLLGHDFLKVQCPKKQKFLFFEMLPAWNKMKLLIKLFEHNWEVIHLLPSLQKKKKKTLIKIWGAITLSFTQSTNI